MKAKVTTEEVTVPMDAIRLISSTLRVLDKVYGLPVVELGIWHEGMLAGPRVRPIPLDTEPLHEMAWRTADKWGFPLDVPWATTSAPADRPLATSDATSPSEPADTSDPPAEPQG